MYAQGWQPNIQEKAAEWKKGWDAFNDEGLAIPTNFSTYCPRFQFVVLCMKWFGSIISNVNVVGRAFLDDQHDRSSIVGL